MTPEEVVRGELSAWDRLDVDAIVSHFAPDAVYDNVPVGVSSGHAEIRQVVEGWVRGMTSLNIEILNLAVAGDVVLIERVDHTITADGKTMHTRAMGAFDIAGDKITAWRDYFEMSHAES